MNSNNYSSNDSNTHPIPGQKESEKFRDSLRFGSDNL